MTLILVERLLILGVIGTYIWVAHRRTMREGPAYDDQAIPIRTAVPDFPATKKRSTKTLADPLRLRRLEPKRCNIIRRRAPTAFVPCFQRYLARGFSILKRLRKKNKAPPAYLVLFMPTVRHKVYGNYTCRPRYRLQRR